MYMSMCLSDSFPVNPCPSFLPLPNTHTHTHTYTHTQARVAAKLKRQQEALVQEGAAKGGGEEGKNYGDSLKREQEKQKALKKDKKQRREDLCEKLGRGC